MKIPEPEQNLIIERLTLKIYRVFIRSVHLRIQRCSLLYFSYSMSIDTEISYINRFKYQKYKVTRLKCVPRDRNVYIMKRKKKKIKKNRLNIYEVNIAETDV